MEAANGEVTVGDCRILRLSISKLPCEKLWLILKSSLDGSLPKFRLRDEPDESVASTGPQDIGIPPESDREPTGQSMESDRRADSAAPEESDERLSPQLRSP